MSTFCVRGGHNFQCPGVSGLIDETVEGRKVCASMIKYFKVAGENVINCTPGNSSLNVDLNFGTVKSNNSKGELYITIHFDKKSDYFEGRIGCEVWVNPYRENAVDKGARIANALEDLGFKNGGLKDGVNVARLHDVRESHMDAIFLSVCYCEATEDVALYKKLGYDKISKTIVEAILDRELIIDDRPFIGKQPMLGCNTEVNDSIANLQMLLNHAGAKLIVNGFYGEKTLDACVNLKFGSENNIVSWLQKRLDLKDKCGKFGTATQASIKKFQMDNDLKVTGEVSRETWECLLK
jgi:N-acetylmuramoyl-L-alanine amidase